MIRKKKGNDETEVKIMFRWARATDQSGLIRNIIQQRGVVIGDSDH